MPVSPADFALWARATGNKYPETAEEKLAAAPHAYTFAKNFGKTGSSVLNERVGGSIFYKQPVSVQNSAPNSLFNSPVTPDNRASKVAGTLDSSLTSEHFQNQEEDEISDRRDQHSLINNVGKIALGAGAVAAGAALATSPNGQQALRTAGTYVKENAQNIGNRVFSFLMGTGGGNYTDPDIIRNSGDVTPPTTSQRYSQQSIPNVTQDAQFAKGSVTGSSADLTVPTTTESYSVKPITESERITTSQTFAPRQKEYEGGSAALQNLEQRYAPSDEVRAARVNAATQALIAAGRTGREPYQMEIPGVGATLMSLRSPLSNVDLNDPSLGLYKENAETPIGPSTHQYSVFDQQPASVSEQTSSLIPTNPSQSYHYDNPIFTTRTGPGQPASHLSIPRPKQGPNVMTKLMGSGEEYTDSPYVTVSSPFENAAPMEGARDVTGSFLKAKIQQLPGPRDIEANVATRTAQGVYPEGRFSSLVSGEEYEPALESRPASMIDPRIVTRGAQALQEKLNTAPGAKADWSERINANEQANLGLLGLKLKNETDPKAVTFLKNITSLHNITEDPNLLIAGGQGAMPINVTLPGGETVPTRSFFKPFGAVGAGPESNLTQVQALENRLVGAQTVLNNTRLQVLNELGLDPKHQLSNLTGAQYKSLSPATQTQLSAAHANLADVTERYNRAKDFQYRYSIPENVLEGTKTTPVISPTTGEVVGMTSVPEEKALSPLEYYKIRSQGGVGRQEVGGVGRRRDALASEHGYSLKPSSSLVQGSLSDVSPVLYQIEHPETGEKMVVPADSVSLTEIAHGTARPIAGTSVEPSRVLGRGDRPYRGISADVISKESFDPTVRAALLQAFPNRETPEGLIYAEGAMERPAGGTNPAAGTRFFTQRPAPAGSPRAAEREQYKQEIGEIAAGTRAPGSVAPFMHQGRKTEDVSGVKGGQVITRQPAAEEAAFRNKALLKAAVAKVSSGNEPMHVDEPHSTTPHIVHEFQPTQLTIPGAGMSPQVRQSQADVEAAALANYMAQRAPGRSLGSQLQRALSNAAAYQPSLF
jgi:hypothetical protein